MAFTGSVVASGGQTTVDRYAFVTNYNPFHPSAAETTAYTGPALDCSSGRFGMMVFDMTALTGTSVTVLVEEYDIASTKWIQVAAAELQPYGPPEWYEKGARPEPLSFLNEWIRELPQDVGERLKGFLRSTAPGRR